MAELIAWWLNSVTLHQVRTSTFDSYRRFGRYFSESTGDLRVAPLTVLNSRKVARQVFAEAVRLRLIPSNPFDLVKPPRAQRVRPGRALSPADAKALIVAAQQLRLGPAVTLLFCQGWRVSEVLGLAWEDLDLDAGTAHIRRGAAYTSSTGTALGPTKTSSAGGVHFLAPVSVGHLRQRRNRQDEERQRCDGQWPTHSYDGEELSMVFTTTAGQLTSRQTVLQAIERAARSAGIDPADLGTHSGRRTVITALYADGRVDLADIALRLSRTAPSSSVSNTVTRLRMVALTPMRLRLPPIASVSSKNSTAGAFSRALRKSPARFFSLFPSHMSSTSSIPIPQNPTPSVPASARAK